MRKTATILFTVALAVFVTPLRMPSASCILSNGPSQEACQPHCCANMACCAVSKENKGPASQPLFQSGAAKEQVLGLIVAPAINSHVQPFEAGPIICAIVSVRAYSPPPLAANCIRLI